MAKDLEVGVKITADSKGLVGESRAAKEAIRSIGDTAKTSNAESSAAADRFVSSLKRQADTLGMTASQVRAYDAAQLKMNEAQRAAFEASNRAITAYESQRASVFNLKSGLVAAAGAYISYEAALAGGKAIIDAALAQDRLNNTLKVGTGSAEAAARETQFLREESEKLGLQFATTSQQYAKLSAAAAGTALQGQATRDIFLGIAKASTVLELRADQTAGALLAIEQMISKGNVSAEELRGQLGERLPGAFQMAARAMGVTTQELGKMLVKGEVTATRLLPALAIELEKTFGAQAQEAAQGLGAKINRLDNAFTDLKIAIGNTGLIDLLSNGIVLATRFVDALSGAKVLSAVDAQKQKIAEMRAELESLGNSKHILVIGNLLFDKKQADLLSQRIDDGVADLARLEKAAADAAEAMSGKKTVTPGAKPELPKEWADALEKQAKAREKAAADAAKQAQQAVDSSNRIIAALKLETEQIGLNAIQKRMMSAAAEAAKAPTQELANEIMEAAAAWGYAAQQQENLQAAEKERIEGLRAIEQAEKEAARATEARARESSAYWNQMWRDVEQTGRTVFTQLLVHGKSAFESVGDTLKIAVADVLYQLTARRWLINIGASLEGTFLGAAGTTAASSGSTALSIANLGTSALNLVKGGFGVPGFIGNMGSSLPGSMGSFFTGMSMPASQTAAASFASTYWGASGISSAASMGSAFAAAAGPLMAAYMATQLFRGLAGDKRIGGGFGKFINKIGDIPILGDLMPGIPLLNALFGRGPTRQQGTLLTGEIGAEGFGSGYLQTRFKAEGGLFRSDKIDYARVDAVSGEVWTDNNKLLDYANDLSKTGKELFGLINDTTKQTSSSLRQIGQDLGISIEGIDGFRHSINLLSEKGKMLTEEQIGEEIQKITDGLAHSLLPQVDELAKRGETALQTVSRLGTEFTTLVDAATLILGKSAADARTMILGATFEGRTGFVDAAGGADALTQMSQYFAANFLTDTERLAPKQEALNTELNNLGLSVDLTRDQFRDLVRSFGEVGGVSEEVMLSLLRLAPEFINVRNAHAALAESARNTAQINEEGVKALMQTAITTRQAALAAQRAELRAGMDDAFRSLQRAVDEERKSVGKHIDDIAKSIDRLKNLSGSLQSALGRMQISGNQAADRVAAQAQITAALAIAKASGTLPDAQSLSRALDVVAQPSEALFGSFVDYARDFARTAADIRELDRMAQDQLGAQDAALGLEQSQLTALDNILIAAQQEIDAIIGVNTTIASLASAISGFAAATAAVRQIEQDIKVASAGLDSAVLGGAGNAAISGRDIALYINTSGATPDQILAKALETGVSAQQVVDAMGGMQGYTLDNIRGFVQQKGLIPGFADGGFHRGGLRIVGETGPEIEYTGPSRIFSNAQSRELLDLSAVIAELKSLRTELAEIKASTSASAASNAKTAALLDDVSAGGGPLLVTQVP